MNDKKTKNLINIYTAENEIQANIVKGYLENNSIKAFIQPDRRYFRQMDFRGFQGIYGGSALTSLPWLVYVNQDKEQEAKNLLENFSEDKLKSEYKYPLR